MVAMNRRAEANQCEIDRIVGGTPAASEPSRSAMRRGHSQHVGGRTPYLVLHQVKLSTTNDIFKKREVNGRLCIGEVGVDLELCVHAHGHDVHLSLKLLLN